MTTRVWYAEHAWVADRVRPGVVIEATDGTITHTGYADSAPEGATRLGGVTLPGFVNAHSHAFHRLLRGGLEHPTGGDDFWRWRDAMYHLAFRLDPDRYRQLARAVFAEMALAGITAVGEFHYVHHNRDGRPYDDANEMGKALIAAAEDVGIRLTVLDSAYLRSGFGDDPLNRYQIRFADRDVHAWAERVERLAMERKAPTIAIGVAAHSVRALRPPEIAQVVETARRLDAPLHFHLSEQPAENQACVARFGRTPAQIMAEVGALGERATAVHATHLTPADIALLGGSGTTACLCPTTERELGDGIGPASELALAGAPLAVGTDAHSFIDMFEEARAIELDDRLRLGRRDIHHPAALLAAATSAGSRSIGTPEVGLRAGAPADFVAVDVDNVRLVGWNVDYGVAPLLFAANATDVTDVVVNGEQIVTGRTHRHLDVVAELRAAIEAMEVPTG